MATAQDQAQSVRFSDVHEEIEPQAAVDHVTALTGAGEKREEPLSPEAEQELRNLSKSLQQSRCQARRMANFAYEPVSLPPSRVCMSVPYLVTVWLIQKKRHRHPRLRHAHLPATPLTGMHLVLAHLLLCLRCIHHR